MSKEDNKKKETIELPCGQFCSGNCADGCRHWNPYDRDSNGRQYCGYYDRYFYPHERNGCLSKE